MKNFLISLCLALLSAHGGTNLFLALSNQLKLEILPENMSSQLRFLKIINFWFVEINFQPIVRSKKKQFIQNQQIIWLKHMEWWYRFWIKYNLYTIFTKIAQIVKVCILWCFENFNAGKTVKTFPPISDQDSGFSCCETARLPKRKMWNFLQNRHFQN